MKILLSGGGFAGMTAAYWLKQYGMTPVVVERAGSERTGGYAIDYFATAYDVGERMRIIPELAAQPIDAAFLGFIESNGEYIARLYMTSIRKAVGGKYLPLMHGTIEQALYHSVREDVEFRFNTTVRAVEQSPDSVLVTLSDGTTETVDLVIGADGVHSRVRELVFGPEQNYAHFMGYHFASYPLPNKYNLPRAWINYNEPGRQIGTYPNRVPGETVVFLTWRAEDTPVPPRFERAAHIRKIYDGMGWLGSQLVNDLAPDTEIFMDTVSQIQMEHWSRGRVVLVGDACGCPTFLSGQGASLAMGGAYILAQELDRNQNYADAFAYYEHRMLPQTTLRQAKARDFAGTFVPDSKLGVTAAHIGEKIIMRDRFTGLLGDFMMGDSILDTEGFYRLPESHDNLLGYRIAGKLKKINYETIDLDMSALVEKYKGVRLLIQLDDFRGIEPAALWSDYEFGREYRDAIAKLAVVGNTRLADWASRFAKPFYAQSVKHFDSDALNDAWKWLEPDAA